MHAGNVGQKIVLHLFATLKSTFMHSLKILGVDSAIMSQLVISKIVLQSTKSRTKYFKLTVSIEQKVVRILTILEPTFTLL